MTTEKEVFDKIHKERQNEINFRIICNSLKTLTEVCPFDEDKLVDLLTDWLWDDDEALRIKSMLKNNYNFKSTDKYNVDEITKRLKEELDGVD